MLVRNHTPLQSSNFHNHSYLNHADSTKSFYQYIIIVIVIIIIIIIIIISLNSLVHVGSLLCHKNTVKYKIRCQYECDENF